MHRDYGGAEREKETFVSAAEEEEDEDSVTSDEEEEEHVTSDVDEEEEEEEEGEAPERSMNSQGKERSDSGIESGLAF